MGDTLWQRLLVLRSPFGGRNFFGFTLGIPNVFISHLVGTDRLRGKGALGRPKVYGSLLCDPVHLTCLDGAQRNQSVKQPV